MHFIKTTTKYIYTILITKNGPETQGGGQFKKIYAVNKNVLLGIGTNGYAYKTIRGILKALGGPFNDIVMDPAGNIFILDQSNKLWVHPKTLSK